MQDCLMTYKATHILQERPNCFWVAPYLKDEQTSTLHKTYPNDHPELQGLGPPLVHGPGHAKVPGGPPPSSLVRPLPTRLKIDVENRTGDIHFLQKEDEVICKL